jgi:uncharacterized protein YggT (Ycf19 family)
MRSVSLFTYWSLQLPHILAGALILLLLVRLVLAATVGSDRGIARLFGAITWPITAPVGTITPRIVPQVGVIACAIGWLIAARVVLSMVALGLGIRLWG